MVKEPEEIDVYGVYYDGMRRTLRKHGLPLPSGLDPRLSNPDEMEKTSPEARARLRKDYELAARVKQYASPRTLRFVETVGAFTSGVLTGAGLDGLVAGVVAVGTTIAEHLNYTFLPVIRNDPRYNANGLLEWEADNAREMVWRSPATSGPSEQYPTQEAFVKTMKTDYFRGQAVPAVKRSLGTLGVAFTLGLGLGVYVKTHIIRT